MNYLLALSFDCDSFPSIQPELTNPNFRFGAAWYSLNNSYATVIKNVKIEENSKLTEALNEGKYFDSGTFLCSYHDVSELDQQKGSQIYRISFGGRDWVMTASLNLKSNYRERINLGRYSFFKPAESSDEEYIFCWILEQIHSQNHNSLSEVQWAFINSLFDLINEFGKANIILSDGQDIVVYQDKYGGEPIYGTRSCPPHSQVKFDLEKMSISIDAQDLNHTMILFANQQPKTAKDFFSLLPGQMVVARRGIFIHDSRGFIVKFPDNIQPQEIHTENSVQNEASITKNYVIEISKSASQSENCTIAPFYIFTGSPDPQPSILSVTHTSHYHYSSPVYLSKHLFRLFPVHDLTQTVLKFNLKCSVRGKSCNFFGAFGNNATTFDVSDPFTDFLVTSEAIVAISDPPAQRFDLLHHHWTMPLIWMPWDRIMMQAYITPPELSESELVELSNYAMSFVRRNDNDAIEVLNDINRTIYRDYSYVTASTTLATTPYEVYVRRQGVCQDFANLFICLARLLNIPARYRVGYIYTGADYENTIQSEASHAWVEVYLPSIGWLGFDPTNCCPQTKNHIRVACGRNYRDATPTSGTIFKGGGNETLSTYVQVVKLDGIDLESLK